jgi:hypothetical protein
MPIDYRRVVLAAVEAALEDSSPSPAKKKRKSRLSTGRALVLGAGLVTAGRLVAGSRGRDMLDSLQHRMGQNGRADDEEYVDAEGDEDLDEEPEAEAEEDFDEEPKAEAEEDFDDEPEAEADEDFEEDEEQPEATGEEDLDEGDEEEEQEPPAKPARKKAAASRGRGRARA